MNSKRDIGGKTITTRVGRAARVSSSAIRRWTRQIASQFHPERVILFGSYAYGRPRADSDVDILVVMPAANEISQSIRLTFALEPPFPLDLIVRTPDHLRRGLEEGDSFLREVVLKGKTLYAQADGGGFAKQRPTSREQASWLGTGRR